MDVLAIWVGGAIVVAIIANSRGRDPGRWFALALLASPLLAVILVMALGRIDPDAPTDDTHVRCPACAEWVRREAVVCKHCGGHLTPSAR